MKKNKAQDQVNEYKIKFIYMSEPSVVHVRYYSAISLSQIHSNINKIVEESDPKRWQLISIECYNRFSTKWESPTE